MSRGPPPLRCPHCGVCDACDVPTIGPGAGQHAARALCGGCGRFLKWLPRALIDGKETPRMGGRARCLIVGCIGKYGVEVRYATSGAPCANCMLVVSELGQDGKTHDVYVSCACWGKKAEAASELEAGQLALFEGKLAKRQKGESWELYVSGFDLMPLLAHTAREADTNGGKDVYDHRCISPNNT
jgi:hypothetical protein